MCEHKRQMAACFPGRFCARVSGREGDREYVLRQHFLPYPYFQGSDAAQAEHAYLSLYSLICTRATYNIGTDYELVHRRIQCTTKTHSHRAHTT